MMMHVPTLLALLATAFLAIAIFAPKKPPASDVISFAPTVAAHTDPSRVERWTPSSAVDPEPRDPVDATEVVWPTLVDPRAGGCDAATRLALVEALATVRAPWADTILRRALAGETDVVVRAAARGAIDDMNVG